MCSMLINAWFSKFIVISGWCIVCIYTCTLYTYNIDATYEISSKQSSKTAQLNWSSECCRAVSSFSFTFDAEYKFSQSHKNFVSNVKVINRQTERSKKISVMYFIRKNNQHLKNFWHMMKWYQSMKLIIIRSMKIIRLHWCDQKWEYYISFDVDDTCVSSPSKQENKLW